MFKTAIVALTIVGCDCDAKMCEFIRDEQPQWSTMSACESALKSRIVRDHHELYPTVIAVCSVPDDNQRALAMAAYREAVDTAETAPVKPADASRVERIVSGGRAIVSRTTDGYSVARDAVRSTVKGTVSLVTGSVERVADRAVTMARAAW